MSREINLYDYLPDFMTELKEMKAILDSMNPQMKKLYADLELVLNTNFIQTCNEKGIERYEQMLGIENNPSFSLEDRKFLVLSYFNSELPYTKVTLNSKLETLCGKDCYWVEYPEAGIIKVRIGLSAKNMYDQVEKLLKRILPANLLVDYGILWNQQIVVGKFPHKTLKQYTHKEIREEVLV